jgi:hypothetical protein
MRRTRGTSEWRSRVRGSAPPDSARGFCKMTRRVGETKDYWAFVLRLMAKERLFHVGASLATPAADSSARFIRTRVSADE